MDLLAFYNITAIKDHIDKVAPPIIYTVKSAEIVEITPTISLSEKEDTIENRNIITSTLKLFFANAGHPNMIIYEAYLQNLINDGEYVNTARLTLPNNEIKLTQLEYPVLGVITWQ